MINLSLRQELGDLQKKKAELDGQLLYLVIRPALTHLSSTNFTRDQPGEGEEGEGGALARGDDGQGLQHVRRVLRHQDPQGVHEGGALL